ncbi:IS4/Tn5 family transposase DNA-binding protein [Nostoc sp.]|uniref:IS4/Tn5 family transposase DNA-binding protein n=1 Tax=Nostoc sp. TaxID=1180 RepID=UPI002FFA2DEC
MSRWWSKNFALSQLGDRRLNRRATEIGKILSQGFGATYFQVNRKGVPAQMGKGRLEAFSDGVIAIIITIMVLEIKVPHESDLAALRPLIPVFLSYVLSFIYIGIYWNNHHHLLQAVRHVNGRILWANLHLLFWLSLIPFVTGWMGENHFAALPVALYGTVLLLAAIAYFILTRALISHQGRDSTLAIAVGGDLKGKVSVVFYAVAIPLAFVNSWFACALYVLVAIMWLIPDRRIEKTLTS